MAAASPPGATSGADAAIGPPGPASPCIRNCCLDEKDVCLGCGRHVDEITGWHGATAAEREAILVRAGARRRARGR